MSKKLGKRKKQAIREKYLRLNWITAWIATPDEAGYGLILESGINLKRRYKSC